MTFYVLVSAFVSVIFVVVVVVRLALSHLSRRATTRFSNHKTTK